MNLLEAFNEFVHGEPGPAKEQATGAVIKALAKMANKDRDFARMREARVRDAQNVERALTELLATAKRQTQEVRQQGERDCTPRRRNCTPRRRNCTPRRNVGVGQNEQNEQNEEEEQSEENATNNQRRIHELQQ